MAMQYNAYRNEAEGVVGTTPHERMSCYIL